MGDRAEALAGDRMVHLAQQLAATHLHIAASGTPSDAELLQHLALSGELGRIVDAHRVFSAGMVADESRQELGTERVCVRLGSRTPRNLIERVTKVGPGAAKGRIDLANKLAQPTSLAGEPLPGRFPQVRQALEHGLIGVDAAKLIVKSIGPAGAASFDLEAGGVAEAQLVDAACGRGSWLEMVDGRDQESMERCADVDDATCDQVEILGHGSESLGDENYGEIGWSLRNGARIGELAVMAQAWALALDPNGTLPNEDLSMRKRGLTMGPVRHGTVSIRGELLPEVAAQLAKLIDAILNPRVEGPPVPGEGAGGAGSTGDGATGQGSPGEGERGNPDGALEAGLLPFVDVPEPHTRAGDVPGEGFVDPHMRNAAQRRHDAVAGILNAAASLGKVPSLGGAPATLVVTVSAEEIDLRHGVAHRENMTALEGSINVRVARQIACHGAVQRVILSKEGRVMNLGTPQRLFSTHQRRAIAARDGGCVIPGCSVPSTWCEIHHVTEYQDGGQTHTDNRVLVCWFHHRTLDESGWQIHMREGVPWIRAGGWKDPDHGWQRARGSAHRQFLERRRNIPPRPDPFSIDVVEDVGAPGVVGLPEVGTLEVVSVREVMRTQELAGTAEVAGNREVASLADMPKTRDLVDELEQECEPCQDGQPWVEDDLGLEDELWVEWVQTQSPTRPASDSQECTLDPSSDNTGQASA